MTANRHLRGIRDSIPEGYILGRTADGEGPVQLLRIPGLTSPVGQTSTSGVNLATHTYVAQQLPDGFGISGKGLFSDAEFLGSGMWSYDITFPSRNFTDETNAVLGPLSSAVIHFQVNGSDVGTLTFGALATSGTVSWGSGYTLTAGTRLDVYAPTTHDTQFYGVTATIYGDRA